MSTINTKEAEDLKRIEVEEQARTFKLFADDVNRLLGIAGQPSVHITKIYMYVWSSMSEDAGSGGGKVPGVPPRHAIIYGKPPTDLGAIAASGLATRVESV
jgi:hypothetical protein